MLCLKNSVLSNYDCHLLTGGLSVNRLFWRTDTQTGRSPVPPSSACFCWLGVTLYFFQRYTLSAWIALATGIILRAYKIAVIGW